jgi:acetylglutamate kinase
LKLLIKIGGSLLDDPASRARLAGEIAEAAREHAVVVVHGGGKQLTRFLAERGGESRFVNGLRVTTPEVLDGVLKVLAGSVNSGLVAAFRAAGARPVGLTGVDAGLVDAAPLDPDLGHVGRPIHADAGLLDLLVREAYLPVVACVAGDAQGQAYNVNADQMAAACAAAFRADHLIFLTDVDGVLDASGRVCSQLTCVEARQMIAAWVAKGGMQAKLEAAFLALNDGVGQIRTAPGAVAGIVKKVVGGDRIGTRLVGRP